ncbi:MAG: HipA domain-containing protein [Bacteroidetes bacterium]|nr:HipA domain-containing protein [Bacteroidota bacterium]
MTKNNQQRSILVYAHWASLEQPMLMGTLLATHARGKEVFSFEYDDAWLKSKNVQSIDPDLQLYSGQQFLRDEKKNFGLFLDSSPDRWGRVLMDRREAILARKEERKAKLLFESDYLLGVYDAHRMGALRFKENAAGDFLNNNKEMASPPWSSIRELEQASLKLEEEDGNDNEKLKWLNLLMAPGSSLGGARPKASVLDEKGNLWIAKFPSKNDGLDVGGWEMVLHELAIKAGLNVATATTGKFYSRQHTFLTKRFDRTKNKRIHFASAMTLLGHTDGTNYEAGISYLDLAGFIIRHGGKVNVDLEELWRRIVFYICVSNIDDHLRNHGFLLSPQGWMLSPAYDINPVEKATGLSLNISENDNSLNLELALDVATYFRVSNQRAKEIILKVKKSVSGWSKAAEKTGIPRSERDLMSRAFKFLIA